MKILLRVEHPTATEQGDTVVDAGGATDVEVDVAAGQTIAELARAVTGFCGLPDRGDRSLLHLATKRLLQSDVTVGEAGLVSGDTIALGRPGEGASSGRDGYGRSGATGGTAPSGLHLVIVSGVDAGRHFPLVPGEHIIGRDRTAALRLRDPQVSRLDFTLRITPREQAADANPSPLTESGPLDAAFEIDRPVSLDIMVDPGSDRTNELRLNGTALAGPAPVRAGDDIHVGATTFQVRSPLADRRQPLASSGGVAFERTPQFHQPIEQRVFDPLGRVPVKPEPRRFQVLAFVAPLIMGFAMAYLFKSPRYLLFAVLSPVVAIGNYFDSKRSGGKDYKIRLAEYRERIAVRQLELVDHLAAERRLRHRNSPDPVELVQHALTHHKRLWNRARSAQNFLDLRAGLGSIAADVVIKPEVQGDDDLRVEAAEAMAPYDRIVDVPVTMNLAEAGVVGLVGSTIETSSFVTGLAIQAGCLHSPEDLVIAAALPHERGINEWLKWLPHTRSKNSPLGESHLAGDREQADRLIRSVGRIVEARALSSEQRIDLRWPWILLVVDRSLDPDPSTMARLLDLGADVGLSVVWLTDNDRFVPRQAEIVAHLRAPGDGVDSRLSFVDPEQQSQDFEPVRIGTELADRAARSLAPLLDASATNAAAAVPSMVTLFEALGVDRIEPSWIAEQWFTDRGYALPTPVGLTDTGPLTLDLVRHGPHGLIGGTSGAGKSELVQSLVANLIALNSPERVNLLFIDYKGGALSGLFSDVPHSVGAVTNLDAMLSLRALTSLKAELDQRMALFEEKRVKDIKEMLEKHPDAAPASLVIVVDEFASLVRELPEFVEGIVSIAERGRSLGIHLLLSTQRPSGSINENIQQNTNLRMSLRMLDSGESNNVIGTPDAATIPGHLKGRGFARLGPGELIAFQSSWSGAPLGGEQGQRPITVRSFTTIDERRKLPAPTEVAADTGSGPVVTELDAVLEAIVVAAEKLGMGRGRAPWKETLPNLIPLDHVLDDPRSVQTCGSELTIGMVDNPQAQDQYPVKIDLADGGGLAVFGCGGSGKTTTLLTAACSAAIRDSQLGGGKLSVFGIDFGSRQLGVLNRLPQCETVANGDDLEAVTRVAAVLSSLFAERQAVSAEATNAGQPAPEFTPVLLLIDGYDALADVFMSSGSMTVMQPWYDRINHLVSQGRQVGIYSILSSGSISGPAARLMNAISNRITLRQTDDNTYRAFGVPSNIANGLDLEPGQALTRTGEGMQIAVVGQRPGPDGEFEIDPGAVGHLAEGLVGSVLPDCRTQALPELVGREPAPTADVSQVHIGVADLSLDPVAIDLAVNSFCVLGPPRSGRSTSLLTVAAQLEAAGIEVWAFGSAGSILQSHPGWAGSAFGRPADVIPILEQMTASVEQFTGVTRFMIFDDADRFDDMSMNAPLKGLLEAGVKVCGAAGGQRSLVGSNPLHKELKAARNLLVLKAEDEGAIQAAVGARYGLRPGLEMVTGRGVLISDGIPTVIQAYSGTAGGSQIATQMQAPLATPNSNL